MTVTLNADLANIPPPEAHIVLEAIAAFARGEFLASIHGLRIILQNNADSAQAHYHLALALEHGNTRDFGECHRHFERALELAPGWFDALYHYGRVLLHSSREEDAKTALLAALAQQPDHPGVNEQLSGLLIEQSRFNEALPFLEKAVELMPERTNLSAELERTRDAAKATTKVGLIARYPRAIREFDDMSQVIDRYILGDLVGAPRFLHQKSKVFTMGSCFAANIAVALRRFGLSAKDLSQTEEINNTFANRGLAEWIVYGDSHQTSGFEASFGEEYRKRLAYLVKTSDVFILSLGVAPCFFNRTTGAFLPTHGMNHNTSLLINNHTFRMTTVSENLNNLTQIAKLFRTLNPDITIVLTVSPVPLKATMERKSAIIADCISKSTLRVTAHEFVSSESGAGVIYWPSFEMIRWLGAHAGRVYGNDDGSPFHPDQSIIEMIMAKFVLTFGDDALRSQLR